MKKVYLIYECSGSWEDYNKYLVDSRFDKDESDDKLKSFNLELKNKKEILSELQGHMIDCIEEECSKCDDCFELGMEIDDINGYRQDEVEVLEKGEGDIDV